MMDTEEIVIKEIVEKVIEKVMENRNLNNEFIDCTSDIESNNVPCTSEDNSSACKENIEINITETNQCTDDREIVIINDVETEQNSNKKDNLNEPENKSAVASNIEQNEIFINNNDKNQDKDIIILENLKQKKDDDIYIIHEVNAISSAQKSDKVSSLVSIALEYGDSDSETECNIDEIRCDNNQSQPLKEIQMQTYRQNKEVSSSEESDTEDSSDSSEIESIESDDDILSKKNKGNNERGQKNNEVKSELDDLPPIEDLKISVPEVLCDPLGEVAWMVEQLVVVKPKPGKPTLNLDTILFVDKGQRTLGKIFDVFGQVNEPHYCVRFNSSKHITECNITVGMNVYYCPNTEYTSLVFLHELLKIKGIDANADDPPEFSDDEEERVYYEQQKAKQTNNIDQTDIPFKRNRISNKPTTGWQSNHPWNRKMQNQRRGFYGRIDKRYPSMQTNNQSQNLWSQFYQNRNEPYEHGMHSLQYMQYMNYNSGVNQNFYGSHNYYNENAASTYLNPKIPFNSCQRVPPPGYITPQNHPNSSTNVRFQPTNIPWLPQMPQVPIRMNLPWIPVPPSPPLPPTSSSSNTI